MASMTTRKRSSIWEYFSVVQDTKFTIILCSLCSKQVPCGGDNTKSYTTSNIIHHLKSKHPEEHKKYEDLKAAKEKQNRDKQTTKIGNCDELKLKQVMLTEAKELRLPWDINDHCAKFIHIKITEMIALDCQPYSVVDDGGFKALVHALEPKYQIPSQRYFCKIVIPSIVRTMQKRITKNLEEMQYVSLTSDIWSSDVNNDFLLSVTARWLEMIIVSHYQQLCKPIH